ncbi:MAG TPA: hypothetical protein PK689_06310, partial [Kiritimatiellia bacterium]|nr:hypothetical protein [Kiritimatiellia bacterium]
GDGNPMAQTDVLWTVQLQPVANGYPRSGFRKSSDPIMPQTQSPEFVQGGESTADPIQDTHPIFSLSTGPESESIGHA